MLKPRLFEGDGADIFALAGLAAVAFPEGIELSKHGIDQPCAARPDAKLKVAAAVGFGAQPGAGEICAAEVHSVGIDHHRLEMQPGASADRQVVRELFLQLPQGGGTGSAGMHQADFHSFAREPAQDLHDGNRPPGQRLGDEHGLEIRRGDVDAERGAEYSLPHDLLKVLRVCHQFD
jgi:hypothetical protein